MRFRASFNPAPLKRKINNRARGFSKSLPDLLRRAGRIVAVSLATSTQPYGLDQAARKSGEIATRSDVLRCYATPGQVFGAFPDKRKAAGFWSAMSKGNWATAQNIMQRHCPKFRSLTIRPFDDGAAHRANRNSRGRVSKKQSPIFVVQTTRNLLAYVEKEVRQVGFGKSGWGACAKILDGTRGLSQWITRHKAPGTVIEDRNAERPTITLRNEVNYASDILSRTDKQIALRIGIDRLSKSLITEERHLARLS